ncbi:MAG: flagellar assembly protein FliW [Gemmatimonadota bacterium]
MAATETIDALASPSSPVTINVRSELLGEMIVSETEVFNAPSGIYGFPESRRFALVRAARSGMYWLQSIDHSALAFLLVDPFSRFPGYHLDLDDSETARLGTADPQNVLALAIVTLPGGHEAPWTANLHAPILFNVESRSAFQSIRADDSFGIREEFRPE